MSHCSRTDAARATDLLVPAWENAWDGPFAPNAWIALRFADPHYARLVSLNERMEESYRDTLEWLEIKAETLTIVDWNKYRVRRP